MHQHEHGKWAVAQANKQSDYLVLAATFIVFFSIAGIYFLINYFTSDDFLAVQHSAEAVIAGLIGALFASLIAFAVTLVLGMLIVRIQRQTMLGNSLQVEYSDYAWLREWVNVVARDLHMPHIEVFVTQDPVINAYAFGFISPYTIVLQSGSIRYLTRDELKAVVVHEMGHIKYGHTIASVYLRPFLVIPVINIVGEWIAGFWQRRTELTCDRLALMYMGDSELVKASLIKVHVGPDVAGSMNHVARQWLQYNAERPMNRFAQTFSTHPFLVRRLSHIDRYKHVIESVHSTVRSVGR
jgi:Zn-dependent protease with chaperone function